MRFLFLFLILPFFMTKIYAGPFWVGTGTVTHNFLKAQNSNSGSRVAFGYNASFGLGMLVPFTSNLYFAPGLAVSLFGTKGGISKRDMIIQYQAASPFLSNSFLIHYGFSNYITTISGKGGTVSLNNGTGTADFYTPKTSKSSYTSSADIGGQLFFNSDISFKLQFSIMRFLSSRRSISHLAFVNYYF